MIVRRAYLFLLVLLVMLALGLRLPRLGERPFHADESVHAVKCDELRRTGRYVYDPNEFHGPIIYYTALPIVVLRGHRDFASTTEADYRAIVALFGAGMLLFLPLFGGGLGRTATLITAAFLAVSPAFVFYSRYYIQETPLVFATLGMLACGFRYLRRPGPGWAVGVGACAGLMVASKETSVLTFGAALVALLLTTSWRRIDPGPRGRNLFLTVGTMLLVAGVFLSGFGSNPRGPLDFFGAFTPWLRRAHATDIHQHPWYYYLRLLLWPENQNGMPMATEALTAALAVVGALARFRSSRLVRFLTIYTLLLAVSYSAIPYKTPWCVLTFLQGMALLAGVGAAWLLERTPGTAGRMLAGTLLLAGLAHLAYQAWGVSFARFNDLRNPFVYSPTAPETARIGTRLARLAQASPDGDRILVKVFSRDEYYWPLPWYLRRFPDVGYWVGVPPGKDADAPIVLASSELDEELTKRLDSTHLMAGYFALRPGVLMQIWVRLDLWQEYLKRRQANPAAVEESEPF